MRGIALVALAGGMTISAAMVSPSPALALGGKEALACVNAFVLDPQRSACQAAIQSIQCANLDAEYERDEQISACTAASESANWSRRSMAEIFINRGTDAAVSSQRSLGQVNLI